MTFFIKCDTCGIVQESEMGENGRDPINPINPATGKQWYSRVKDGKIEHACSLEHIKSGMVWPEWAK